MDKTLPIEEYLEKIRPCLSNMINNLKTQVNGTSQFFSKKISKKLRRIIEANLFMIVLIYCTMSQNTPNSQWIKYRFS